MLSKKEDQRATLLGLWQSLGEFRKLSNTLSLAQAQAFLLVALNEGKSINELADLGKLKQSTISRSLLDLSGHGTDYSLITREGHPEDLRKTVYTVNAKGRALINRLVDHLSSVGE